MATAYKTPGVYVEETDAFPLSVAGVDTAIPVFVGKTKKGPTDEPVLINTLAEYMEVFGKADEQEFTAKIGADDKVTVSLKDNTANTINLFYHMQMYFANGGSTCYVLSVSSIPAISTKITDKLATKDDITMVVLADLLEDLKYDDLRKAILAQCSELNRFLLVDMEYGSGTATDSFRTELGSEHLKYAAAYTPYLNTSLSYCYGPDSIAFDSKAGSSPGEKTGAALSTIKDSQLYNEILAEVARFRVDNMPPSSAMAGIYAKVDRDRGVWKAPANISLNAVVAPAQDITAQEQESLNVDPQTGKSINAIRQFPGKGNMVWGARTLDGNSNDWRYISVRRTVSYVEQSLDFALQNYVFEANNDMTWLKVNTMISTFLENLWLDGGLVGSSAGEAFFVNIGLGTTMTPQDILEGRMKISIGLSVVRPAEFIVLEVTQMLQK